MRRIEAVIAVLLCTMLAFLGISTPCSATETPKSGNVFIGEGVTPPEAVIKRDLVWAGRSLELGNYSIGNDLLAAGQTIAVAKTAIDGSIRAAAQDIDVRGCEIGNNVTLAGESIDIDSATIIKGGAYLAGQSITFSGTTSDVFAAGQTISIGGKIASNVTVYAENVFVQAGTQIIGTLTVCSSNKPDISSKSEIGEYKFIQQDSSTDTIEESIDGLVGFSIVNAVRQILALVIAALLLALLFPRQFRLSAVNVRKRLGYVVLSGFVGLIAGIPLVVLALLITFEGGLALLLAFLAFALLAVPFTSATLGPLFFKNMNRVLSSILVAAMIALVGCIPAVGIAVWFACLVFTIGCVIQIIWAGMKTGSEHGAVRSLERENSENVSRVE